MGNRLHSCGERAARQQDEGPRAEGCKAPGCMATSYGLEDNVLQGNRVHGHGKRVARRRWRAIIEEGWSTRRACAYGIIEYFKSFSPSRGAS